MQRTTRGFTVIELVIVLVMAAAGAAVVVWFLYGPWVLLYCLKNMGITSVAYTSEAWWGAFWAMCLFVGNGALFPIVSALRDRPNNCTHGPNILSDKSMQALVDDLPEETKEALASLGKVHGKEEAPNPVIDIFPSRNPNEQ